MSVPRLAVLFCGLSVAATTGCTSTQLVTPWLRTTSTTSYEKGFIAESGGSGPRTTGKVERLEKGVWTVVEGWTSRTAVAFADDTRVLVGHLLVPQIGAPVPIDCVDDLRVAPGDLELLCVGTYAPAARGEPTDLVRIRRFDLDGKLVAARTLPPPARPDADGSSTESVTTHFLGFGPAEGLFFSVYRSSPSKKSGPDVVDRCEAFALSSSDAWRPAGTLTFTGWDFGKCGNADAWRAETGLPVRTGKRPRPWD